MEEVEAIIGDYLAYFGPGLDGILIVWSANYGEVFWLEVHEEGGTFLGVEVGGNVDLPVGEGSGASHAGWYGLYKS